jgi:hypothetical protein
MRLHDPARVSAAPFSLKDQTQIRTNLVCRALSLQAKADEKEKEKHKEKDRKLTVCQTKR